jgi:hypothetical protein
VRRHLNRSRNIWLQLTIAVNKAATLTEDQQAFGLTPVSFFRFPEKFQGCDMPYLQTPTLVRPGYAERAGSRI